VKEVMVAAGITGTPAMSKGLRHGFGVNAFQSSVPPHLVQRWLHASLRTTAIYGDVIGHDERAFADAHVGRSQTIKRPAPKAKG
jgi:integrase/recombinase XerD